jgi:hypothetical protein
VVRNPAGGRRIFNDLDRMAARAQLRGTTEDMLTKHARPHVPPRRRTRVSPCALHSSGAVTNLEARTRTTGSTPFQLSCRGEEVRRRRQRPVLTTVREQAGLPYLPSAPTVPRRLSRGRSLHVRSRRPSRSERPPASD